MERNRSHMHSKVVVHLAAAAHHIAHVLILIAVAGAAGQRLFLQNMDMASRHLAVADQKQAADSAARPEPTR
jgi:hypothetical protein